MKKINKKGFTIVELVIVIAVVAILCAILIPTFVSLAKKAKVNNDMVLVKNLNTILAMCEATDGKNQLMGDALTDVYDNGYVVANLTPTAEGYDIVWDSVNDRFRLYNGSILVYSDESKTEAATQVDLWKIYSEIPATKNQTYSIYLHDDSSVTSADVKVGLDVGNNTNVTDITYTNDSQQDVVIRTNTAKTTLTINDKSQSDINQYGELGELIIEKCAMHSIYINGSVSYVQITEGHLVVNETGEIELIYKNSAKASDAIVQTNEGGVVHHAHAISESVAENKDENNNVLNVTFDYDNSNIVSETTVDHTTGEYASESGWVIEKGRSKVVAEAIRKEVVNKYADSKTWIECVDEDYFFVKGTGTSEDPYQVSNPADLAFIAYMVNKGDEEYASAHYILTCDIALAERSWYPIGTFKYPFHGYIDGNNKTISGFTATDDSMNAQSWFTTDSTKVTGFAFGLIGVAANGEMSVKDLTFEDVDISVEKGNCVGVVLGYAPSYEDFNGDEDGNIKANGIGIGNNPCTNITLDNIIIKNGSIYALQDAAGIAGKVYGGVGTINITNCTNNADVTVADNDSGRAAGIVSYMANSKLETNVNIIANTNNGAITSHKYIAGITNAKFKTRLNISNNTNNGILTYNANLNYLVASIVYLLNCNFEHTFANNVDTANESMSAIKVDTYSILENRNITINNGDYTDKIKCYGTLTVNGGTFTDLYLYAGSNATINDGDIEDLRAYEDSQLTINGGTIAIKTAAGEVTVNGGVFEYVSSYKNLTIKGGTYTSSVISYIDNENYHIICNEDGEYVVKSGKYTNEDEANFEAKVKKTINDVDYYIFYNKVENAFADGTTFLLKDINTSVELKAEAKRYLYVNGHSLTCTISTKKGETKYDLVINTSAQNENITINSIEANALSIYKANYVIKGGSVTSIKMYGGTSSCVNSLTLENGALEGVNVTMAKYNKLTDSEGTIENKSTVTTPSHTIK